ncbi:hypothetical protein AB0D56_09885 [Streptomyces sp. NPDC048209]|uniref:hypothetical protein n=1 Tax=Streptomyces sp. NPDC048209 TaxID=3156689 RepID=UPI0034397747
MIPTYVQILAYALAEAARLRQHQAGLPLDPYPPCYQCGGVVTGAELTTAGLAVLTHTIALIPCGCRLAIDEQTVARLADDVPRPELDLTAIGAGA